MLLAAGLTPLWILVIRFVLGFAALSCLRPHRLRLANPRDGRLFAAAGFTGVACYFLLENVALTFTSATAVGAICATSPLFCILIALARGQRPASPASFAIGFVLAMGGILLVGAPPAVGVPSREAPRTTSSAAGWPLSPRSCGPPTQPLSAASPKPATRP